jgi:hypothetical protein
MAHVHFTLGTSGHKLRVSEYVIVIEFLPEQWLYQRALTLRYTYIACLVYLLTLHFHVADRKKKDCDPNGCIDPPCGVLTFLFFWWVKGINRWSCCSNDPTVQPAGDR